MKEQAALVHHIAAGLLKSSSMMCSVSLSKMQELHAPSVMKKRGQEKGAEGFCDYWNIVGTYKAL